MFGFSMSLLVIFVFLWVYFKNKKAKPSLLDESTSNFIDIKVDGSPQEVFKAILKFSQYSDYKIDFVKEDSHQLILNYFPKLGEQANGAFFPIKVTSISDGSSNVRVAVKDKGIAFQFESRNALNKMTQALKASLLSENFTKSDSQSNSQNSNTELKEFSGERLLENDAYKIFLSKKYSIKRNDLFNKFEANEKLFDTLDDALNYANENEKNKPNNSSSSPPQQSPISEPQNISEVTDVDAIKYGITFDGEKYHYKSYRYDRLSDAISYAKLEEKKR